LLEPQPIICYCNYDRLLSFLFKKKTLHQVLRAASTNMTQPTSVDMTFDTSLVDINPPSNVNASFSTRTRAQHWKFNKTPRRLQVQATPPIQSSIFQLKLPTTNGLPSTIPMATCCKQLTIWNFKKFFQNSCRRSRTAMSQKRSFMSSTWDVGLDEIQESSYAMIGTERASK